MISTICTKCNGNGKVYRSVCPVCNGEGHLLIDEYDCRNVEQITEQIDMEITYDDGSLDS